MNNDNTSVQSLFNLALEELSDEDFFKSILNCYPTSIIFKIIWKILNIQNENNEFVYYHTFNYMESSAYKKGTTLIHMLLTTDSPLDYFMETQSEVLDNLTRFQQLKFLDTFHFCYYFDLELFFKFVEYTSRRNDLFVLFQICVQKRGLEFPKQFAKMWIESKTEDETYIHDIERGLKLGIFLGDSGWYSESAFVLSYTYKIISTKCVYSDQNLKLTQSIQCLTKWLLVVIFYHDFNEAKVILSHILNNIEFLEQTEGRHLHIINAYIAVSEYYFVIMDYDESWLWASKAVNELHDEISEYLKLLVMSHCIKVCSSTDKLKMANIIVEKLFANKNEINLNFYIDIFRNIAYHLVKEDSSNVQNYFVALDSSRNLFGYYNLHTAAIFVDYAYAKYIMNYPGIDLTHVMSSITQGIYIMEKIGIPDNNMMLVNARMLKSFILQKLTLFNVSHPHNLELVIPVVDLLRKNVRDSESYHIRAIQLSRKIFREENMLTARLLYYLGKLYIEQGRILNYKLLRFNSLLSRTSKTLSYYTASQIHLNYLYKILKKINMKSEQAFLKSIKIYESICGPEYFWLLHLYQKLLEVYTIVHDSDKRDACLQKIHDFEERMSKKEEFSSSIHKIHENCLNDGTILEIFKSITINNID